MSHYDYRNQRRYHPYNRNNYDGGRSRGGGGRWNNHHGNGNPRGYGANSRGDERNWARHDGARDDRRHASSSGYINGYQQNGHQPPQPRPDAPSSDAVPSAMNVDTTHENSRRPTKAFLDMEYKEQLEAQIPHTETDKEEFKGRLPVESLHPRTPAGKKPHLIRWNRRKEDTAQELVKEMKVDWPQAASIGACGYDSDEVLEDYQNDMLPSSGGPRDPILQKKVEDFILALPTCHLLTIGFDYSGSNVESDEDMCFCPCHRQQTQQWRSLASIDIEGGEREECGECKNKGRFETPNALMMHLRQMKNCEFHKYTLRYLEELYKDWHHAGLHHKGLYDVGTVEYKKAVALEQKSPDRLLLNEMARRDREQMELVKAMETLKIANAGVADEYKKRQENGEKLFTLLGVDPADPTSWPPTADEMFPKDKKQFGSFLERTRKRLELDSSKSGKRAIYVKQGFSLQDCFDAWSLPESVRSGDFAALVLFKTFNGERDVRQLLSSWKIEYGVHEALADSKAKLREDFMAEDAGGPEQQFFSEVWQKLPNLKVTLQECPRSSALFETAENGYPTYIPMGDEKFDSKFKEGTERARAQEKAKMFYRAIGRIFLHCVVRGHPVPTEVLPKLLCNAILRECVPSDRDYLGKDLGQHMLEIGWNSKTLQEAQEMVKTPEEFRKDIVEERYISGKSIWLRGFQEGVTAMTVYEQEFVTLSDFFRGVSLDNVERLIFATHEFSANDLFKTLQEPDYSNDNAALQSTQRHIFHVGLKNLLEKWEANNRTMLHWFCEFCTGRTYLNTDPQSEFRIKIVFEKRSIAGNSSADDRLPESHTCEAQISFPSSAYNGDVKVLEDKLTQAVECCHRQFTMN